MLIYGIVVGIIAFLVNLLLLLGTDRLFGEDSRLPAATAGALLAALQCALCTISGFRLLASVWMHGISLIIAGLAAFGRDKSVMGKCCIYLFLSMGLGALTAGTGGGIWIGLSGAVAIYFLCGRTAGLPGQQQALTPVELRYNNERASIWALCDTGNTLRDPISGRSVLILGPKIAKSLFGLNQWQLENPVEAIGDIPGLRLIPYCTVGRERGLMLGMHLNSVKVGKWQGSAIVAFAPCGLGEGQTYQALTGGNL